MAASGSAPYSGTCTLGGTTYTPGQDACGEDNVIRTHDYATYRVAYSLTPQEANVLVTLTIPAATLPGTYVGPTNPGVATFNYLDLPTGANGCRNIQSAPVADPPPVGTSGVTADGQKAFCYQPSPSSANNQNFRMRVAGTAPNGTFQPAPIITLTSSDGNTPATALTGAVGPESFYGLNDLVVSAAPRWDAVKTNTFRSALFVPGSGPGGEDGFVFSWNIGVRANGSLKGLEALSTARFVEDYSDSVPVNSGGTGANDTTGANDFPSAQLVTWAINNSFANTNLTGASTIAGAETTAGTARHCGDWRHVQLVLGNVFDNAFYYPGDGGNTSSTNDRYVARGGECVMISQDLPNKTAAFELINTDYSLNRYPLIKGTNPGGQVLVDQTNLDASSNEFWVSSKVLLAWAPVDDIVFPPGVTDRTEFLTNRIQFTGTSVTGQANADPIATNDAWVSGARRTEAGDMSKNHVPWYYNNPQGWDIVSNADPNTPGSGTINQAAPNQYFMTLVSVNNVGTATLGSGYVCDKLDNVRTTMVDVRAAAFTPTVGSLPYKDPLTGIMVRYLAGSPAEYAPKFWLGVGGTGIVNAPSAGGSATTGSGTWETTTTVSNEYLTPNFTTSTIATSDCGLADATWFESITDLQAAGYTLQDVSRIKAEYSSFGAAVYAQHLTPVRVNEVAAFNTLTGAPDVAYTAPGTAVAQGSSTINTFEVNHGLWVRGGTYSPSRHANALKIFQNEYAQISKSSPTHPNTSLVTPGSQVTYNLRVNLSTTGSAHTTDVYVYDVLPQYMSYVSGTSTYGGAAVADPTCVVGPAPWPAGWGEPTTASAAIPADFKACRWELLDQTAIKVTTPGAAAANLPILQFQARVSATAPNGAPLLNTSFADSTDNQQRDARYTSASTGFSCIAGQGCSFSNWVLTVDAAPGAVLNKTVSAAVVPTDTGFSYDIQYGAIGNALADLRIVDVLPHMGDGRVPPTDFTGTFGLTGPVPTPAVSLEGGAADSTVVVLYTSNAHANIVTTPYDASHVLDGTGTNSATTTNWCTGIGGANCPASWADVTGIYIRAKNGDPVAAGEVFSLTVNMAASGNAVGNVYSNQFTGDSPSLTARNPGSNIVTTRVVGPDLTIDKSVSPTQVTAGGLANYQIIVRNDDADVNAGPFLGGTITVSDTLPAGLTIAATPAGTNWFCGASTTTTVICTYSGSYPIPIGGTVGGPITFQAQVPTPLGALTRTYNNTATVSTPTTEVTTTNNSDSATFTALAEPQIGAYKRITAGPTANGDGTWSVSYEVGARNYGPQDVTSFNLTDTLIGAAPAFGSYVAGTPTAAGTYTVPSGVTSCQLINGAILPGASYQPNAGFNGDSTITLLLDATTLPAATTSNPGELNCRFTVRFAPAAGQTHFENTGIASGSADGTPVTDSSYNGTDPKGGNPTGLPTDPANNVPTPLDITRQVQPSVTKVANPVTYIQGDTTAVVYTITVGNTGPDGLAGFTVVDTPASGITIGTWSCAVTTAGTTYVGVTTACGAASGSGTLNTTVDLQPGAVVTYTVNATIGAAVTGDATNTATVSTPPTLPPGVTCTTNCTVTDTSTLTGGPREVQPTITKSANLSSYQMSSTTAVVYTITVGNTGPHGGNGFAVVDTPPSGVTINSWTCAVTTVGTAYPGITTACGAASGSGALSSTANLQPGAVVTYTLNATIDSTASGALTNVATVTAPPDADCTTDCTVSDDSTIIPLLGRLAVTKRASLFVYTPDSSPIDITYTVTVTNEGPGAIVDGTLTDAQPANVTFTSWTCVVTTPGTDVGVVNTCAASGSGSINDTVTLNPGAVLTYTVTAQIAANTTQPVINTATVTTPPEQCASAPCTETVTVSTTPKIPVPTTGWMALMAMFATLVAMAAVVTRRRAQ